MKLIESQDQGSRITGLLADIRSTLFETYHLKGEIVAEKTCSDDFNRVLSHLDAASETVERIINKAFPISNDQIIELH